MSTEKTCLWDPVVQRPIVSVDAVPKAVVEAFPYLFYSGGTERDAPAASTVPGRTGTSSTSYHHGASGVPCIYCTSLGVEVFLDRGDGGKGVRDRAALVVAIVTRTHIIIGCLDTKRVVHVVPLVSPITIETERLKVPLYDDGVSMAGSIHDAESVMSGRSGRRGKGSLLGGQSLQTAPAMGERYLSSMVIHYTPVGSANPSAILLQFPAAVDFDNIITSLRAMGSHIGRSPKWLNVSVDDAESSVDADDVLKESETLERTVPGTLRRRTVLMPRGVCQAPPPTAVIPWVTMDRVVAYLGASPAGTSSATSLTRSAGRRNHRRNMSDSQDPLQQAQQALEEVEAEVRRGLQSLRRDLCSSLQYLREDLVRNGIEARLGTVLEMVGEEVSKERGVIKPMQSELDDVTKLLILRRRELDDAQGAAHQELSQWSQLDSDCRRIELQRLQAAAETKESNATMFEKLTVENNQLQLQVDQLLDSIDAYSGPQYQQLVHQTADLQHKIEAEAAAQQVLAKERDALHLKVGRLAGEEQATLTALQRLRDQSYAAIRNLRGELEEVEMATSLLEGGPLAEGQEVVAALGERMRSEAAAEEDLLASIQVLEGQRGALLEQVDNKNRRNNSSGTTTPILQPAYPGRPTALLTRRPRVGESDALVPSGKGTDRWASALSRSGTKRYGSPSTTASPHVVPTHSLNSLTPSTNRQFYVERSRADEAAAYRDATEMDAQTRLQLRLKTVRDDLSRSSRQRRQ